MKYLKRLGEDCRDDWTDPANEGKYGGYVWQGNMMMDMDVYLYNFLKGLAEETPAIIKRSLRKNDGRHPHAQAHMEGKYSGDLTEIVDTRRLFYIKISDLVITPPPNQELGRDAIQRQSRTETNTMPSVACRAPLGSIQPER